MEKELKAGHAIVVAYYWVGPESGKRISACWHYATVSGGEIIETRISDAVPLYATRGEAEGDCVTVRKAYEGAHVFPMKMTAKEQFFMLHEKISLLDNDNNVIVINRSDYSNRLAEVV